MKKLIGMMTLAATVLVTAFGCQKGEAIAKPERQPNTSSEEPAGLSDDARRSIEAALTAYEQARADLAADRFDAAIKVAARVEASAREAAGKAPASLRPDLERVASAAVKLRDAPKDDPDGVRHLFGEVSRRVVELLVAEQSLAVGRHIFACPMAHGYKKWVQTSAEIGNPYMGTKMPRCGSKSQWEP